MSKRSRNILLSIAVILIGISLLLKRNIIFDILNYIFLDFLLTGKLPGVEFRIGVIGSLVMMVALWYAVRNIFYQTQLELYDNAIQQHRTQEAKKSSELLSAKQIDNLDKVDNAKKSEEDLETATA